MPLRLSRAPVTVALMLVIIAVFIIEWLTGALVSDYRLLELGAITPNILVSGDYWRLLAGMFLHANTLHLAMNLWALFQLGLLFESMFGSGRFLLVYFVSGLCASLVSSIYLGMVVGGGTSVGASGAVFGIFGAFIFSIRRSPRFRHERWARSLVQQMIFWIVVNIALGFMIPNIDNAAHLSGLAVGLLLGLLPHRVPPPPPSDIVVEVRPES